MATGAAGTLDQLGRGDRATVTALDVEGAQRRRLMDLGLVPGTEIRVDMTSPLGDPTAYLVRGSLVVLRRSQARCVHIELGEA
ncbi:FeoA family protein [Haloechinothrix salitolerans]